MGIQQQTSAAYFKILNLLYYAIIAMQLITAAILVLIKKTQEIPDSLEDKGDLIIYVLVAIVLAGILGSSFFYKSQCNKLSNLENLKAKMTGYRSIFIIRLAVLEALTFVALVVFLLTGNLVILAIAGFVLIYSLKLRPVKHSIIRDLNLSSTEIARLEDPNEIIAEFESGE